MYELFREPVILKLSSDQKYIIPLPQDSSKLLNLNSKLLLPFLLTFLPCIFQGSICSKQKSLFIFSKNLNIHQYFFLYP